MEKTSNECSERLCLTIHVKAAPPSAPAAPPTPTTVETAVDGNMSAGRGQEVGAPALVGRGGERDQQRRGPCVMREEDAEMRHEDNRDDQQGAQQHGDLASEVDRVPAVDEEAGEPSPSDGTDARYAIDGGQIPVGVDELEAVVAIEKLGQIEEIEPPDAVGKRLADGEGIEAGAAQQNGVGKGVVAANVVCKVGFKVGLGLGGSCDADGCRGRTARQ